MKSFGIFVVSLAVLASVGAEDCAQCFKVVNTFLVAIQSPKGLNMQLNFIKNEACTMFDDQADVVECQSVVDQFFPLLVHAIGSEGSAMPGIICSKLGACEEERAAAAT